MILKEINQEVLISLKNVIEQLTPEDYVYPVKELSNMSLSKHIRHILDFYTNFLLFKDEDIITYDSRNRGSDIEINKQSAIDCIDKIIQDISQIDLNQSLTLQQEFHSKTIILPSNLYRELLYNLEHTIHHIALIKIALKAQFHYVQIEENFGIAYSTVAATQA